MSSEADNYPSQILDDTMADRKMDSSTKNALYNQRLHGYLKHKKVISNRAVKVKFDDEHQGAAKQVAVVDKDGAVENIVTSRTETEVSTDNSAETSDNFKEKLRDHINNKAQEYGITTDGKIQNFANKTVTGSSLQKVLEFLEDGGKGRNPNGSIYLLKRLSDDEEGKVLMKQLQNAAPQAQPVRPLSERKIFKPERWK